MSHLLPVPEKLWFLHTYCYSHFLSHQSRPAAPMQRRVPLRSSISPCPTGEVKGIVPRGVGYSFCSCMYCIWMSIICVVCIVSVNIIIYSFGCIGLTGCWCYVYVNATYCGVYGTYVGRAPSLQWLDPSRVWLEQFISKSWVSTSMSFDLFSLLIAASSS